VGNSGCASWYGYKYADIPVIEVPAAPEKPSIKSQVIKQDKKYYVSYTIGDAMKLFEFLSRKDAYEDKLLFRIDIMNELIQKKRK
jgi:hypothetical protein